MNTTSIEVKRPYPLVIPHVVCADGYELSVQASAGHYCTPREDWPQDGWTAVEVMADVDESRGWGEYDDGCGMGVYGWVPLEKVRELIADHGGVKQAHAIEQVLKHLEGSGDEAPRKES